MAEILLLTKAFQYRCRDDHLAALYRVHRGADGLHHRLFAETLANFFFNGGIDRSRHVRLSAIDPDTT